MYAINLVPVKSGGGLQNTLSFLAQLARTPSKHLFLIICTGGGDIERTCITEKIRYECIKTGIFDRIFYEFFDGYRIIKKHNVKLVFSIFGGAPLFSPGVYKISGFAYSNIIQREVPFWRFLPPIKRLQKGVIDAFRTWLAESSDEIILETDYLKARAEGILFKKAKLHVVKMSPSLLVTEGLRSQIKSNKESFDILYLAGPHPNKRVHLLGPIFSRLNAEHQGFRLITTLPGGSAYLKQVEQSFADQGCAEALYNIGPVAPESVGRLIAGIDAMINVALLESFSNNWVEAWAADVPLIATNADWAKASCGDAAIYIDPMDPLTSADRLRSSLRDPETVMKMVAAGRKQLQTLPTTQERFSQYMKIIESALARLEGKK
jgi:glycosyltransferase involved in cell wall biosynthesis